MSGSIPVKIVGRAVLGPAPEIPLPLEEMIYMVTSQALADADMDIQDVDGACMAASDLHDGRAISTMTLTGSTGSFRKTEMRMCNDSLAAATFAAAEIHSGAAEALIVCSWTKFSDADADRIWPLAMEPVYHGGLHFHPAAIDGLRRSRDEGRPTTTVTSSASAGDVAVAAVVTAPGHPAPSSCMLTGFGASMGSYLVPNNPWLQSLHEAVDRACENASVSLSSVDRIVFAGMQDASEATLASSLQVPVERLTRQGAGCMDLGYAAGLTAVVEELEGESTGRILIASAGGIGLQNTYAVVLEKS